MNRTMLGGLGALAVASSASGVLGCGRPAATSSATTAGVPLVVVDRENVTLDGRAVASARSVEESQRLTRLDLLYTALRERRVTEAWFDGGNAGGVSGLSALMTSAFAGARKLHVWTGRSWFDATYELPGTASPAAVHTRVDVALEAETARVVWQSDRPCDVVPADQSVARGDLDEALAAGCRAVGASCIDSVHLSVDPREPFARTVDALGIARRHGPTDFGFRVTSRAASSVPARSPGRSCGAPLAPPLVPALREGPLVDASGAGASGLPPAVIQSIVRRNFGAYRACYERGLSRNPKLAGAVAVRLVIDGNGGVDSATSVVDGDPSLTTHPGATTTMPDGDVTSCIVDAFRTLSFPRTSGGNVTVVYPLDFRPGS